MRLVLALLLVCALGVGALYAQTNGFTVVTTEAARRISIADHPRPIPQAGMQLASGGQEHLNRLLKSDGRVAIVNFVYTRCFSICLAMGSEFQQLQSSIRKSNLGSRIRLLSISFDPADTAAQLAHYAKGMAADPEIWQFVGVPREAERRALLAAFGIVVIPAPMGQFVHNAAYHVVTPDGRLTRVVDFSESQNLLDIAMSQANVTDAGTPVVPDGKRL